MAFNHDVVDGAPAARFTRRLKELIERGYGLDADPHGATGGPETAEARAVPAAA